MVIESPSFGTPTPTNGAPPLIEPPLDSLAFPLSDPRLFVEPVPDPAAGPEPV